MSVQAETELSHVFGTPTFLFAQTTVVAGWIASNAVREIHASVCGEASA